MKYLKDYPKVHSLLSSYIYEDVLIGIELLKRLNLTNSELLDMMPARMMDDPDRDHCMKATIPDKVIIVPLTEKVNIYMNSSWIFCIESDIE